MTERFCLEPVAVHRLTQVETFRVGCIGAIDANEMRNVVSAVEATLDEMGIRQVAPAGQRKAA